MATVLVTGGAGYIGSHTCVELLQRGFDVVVVDDLSNSSRVAIERVEELGGRPVRFHQLDLLDSAGLREVFAEQPVDAVIHFAGLKAVGESVADPVRYWHVNVGGAISLVEAMAAHGVRKIVFSSSCTVYGDPQTVPVAEGTPRVGTNPYGRTKLAIEQLLEDVAATGGWHALLLRYFNPIGAHPSGRMGEDPRGTPNNLVPYVMQVAVGQREFIRVWGGDYPTPDGTAIRDYVHVVDLAVGHIAAVNALDQIDGCRAVNLGTGTGSSVLDVIAAASQAVGKDLPYKILDRRPGDSARVFADPSLAAELLGWRAALDLDDMCRDHWHWQRQNPHGYASS